MVRSWLMLGWYEVRRGDLPTKMIIVIIAGGSEEDDTPPPFC